MKKKRSAKTRGARLGQHFLIARWAARQLAEAAGIEKGTVVLEIGPGKGALTRELLAHGARVIAVEKDPALIVKLRDIFSEELSAGLLTIVEDDIRNITPRNIGLKRHGYVLAANIPYYITGEIIRQFLATDIPPRTIALLVQKEVAERIARSKKESILSLSVKAFGTPKFVVRVPARCFNPPPRVDSAILTITDISGDFFAGIGEKQFFDVIHAGFAAKRKQVGGNLSAVFGKEKSISALERNGIAQTARAEDIGIEQWKALVLALT